MVASSAGSSEGLADVERGLIRDKKVGLPGSKRIGQSLLASPPAPPPHIKTKKIHRVSVPAESTLVEELFIPK